MLEVWPQILFFQNLNFQLGVHIIFLVPTLFFSTLCIPQHLTILVKRLYFITSEQSFFLIFLSNSHFFNLKNSYLFSVPTFLFDFTHTLTPNKTFQKALLCYFRRNFFLSIILRPRFFSSEYIYLFSLPTLLFDFIHTTKQYFSKGYIISFQNKFFS